MGLSICRAFGGGQIICTAAGWAFDVTACRRVICNFWTLGRFTLNTSELQCQLVGSLAASNAHKTPTLTLYKNRFDGRRKVYDTRACLSLDGTTAALSVGEAGGGKEALDGERGRINRGGREAGPGWFRRVDRLSHPLRERRRDRPESKARGAHGGANDAALLFPKIGRKRQVNIRHASALGRLSRPSPLLMNKKVPRQGSTIPLRGKPGARKR